jgi:hypothetical protein
MTREQAEKEIRDNFTEIWADGIIKALEPRKGHWIDITNKNKTVIAVRCSCCEKSPKYAIKSDYCPNCGADMRGAE